MRIAAINALSSGSPANIMRMILHTASETDLAECRSFYGNWKSPPKYYQGSERFGFWTENALSAFYARQTGLQSTGSVLGTRLLVQKLKSFQPDLIHLHNLHLWDVNVPILFRYIKQYRIPVVWTLHDCWAFTGRCPHFEMLGCQKWKTGCGGCPFPPEYYPSAKTDASSKMWQLKKQWFSNVGHMTIVTPSDWLRELVKQSFLGSYPIQVIHNGIDLTTFRPTQSNFRRDHGIPENGRLLLGVAFDWGRRKGLDVLLEINRRLSENDRLVLVGTNDKLDRELPGNVISIHRTDSPEKLAEIYSAADVFLNPTREDTYPTVNMEAIACGTPVVTFRSGGSPESLDSSCGIVVPKEDIDGMWKAVNTICADPSPWREGCIRRAGSFSEKACYKAYCRLYQSAVSGK